MNRILKKIATLILAIILFILISIMMFILSSKTLVTKKNLSSYVESVDILNVDLGIIFNIEEKGITLKEEIYDLAIESGIPKPIIEDILESDEINTVLGDFFKSTIDYILRGNIKPSISEEAVSKMVELSFISLEDHMNIMMSEEELESYVRDYCLEITDIVPDRNIIIDGYNIEGINKIVYFDMANLYILIIVTCLLICIVNKSIYKLLKHLGIAMMFNGVLFVVIGCLNDLIATVLSNKYITLENFIQPLITNVLTIVFKNGVLVSFTGVFIYLTYVIANRIKLNNKINELLSKQ